jgi:hypothetical protein
MARNTTGSINLLPTNGSRAQFTLLFSGVRASPLAVPAAVARYPTNTRGHASHLGISTRPCKSRHRPLTSLSRDGGMRAHEQPVSSYLDISTSSLGELARWGASPHRSQFNMYGRPRFASEPFLLDLQVLLILRCITAVDTRAPLTTHTPIVRSRKDIRYRLSDDGDPEG